MQVQVLKLRKTEPTPHVKPNALNANRLNPSVPKRKPPSPWRSRNNQRLKRPKPTKFSCGKRPLKKQNGGDKNCIQRTCD